MMTLAHVSKITVPSCHCRALERNKEMYEVMSGRKGHNSDDDTLFNAHAYVQSNHFDPDVLLVQTSSKAHNSQSVFCHAQESFTPKPFR
jgi:hypothetical protein